MKESKLFVPNSNTSLIQYLERKKIIPSVYHTNNQLINEIHSFDPDCIIHDCGNSEKDFLTRIRKTDCTYIHFDDHGEGGILADIVFQSLFESPKELSKENYVYGPTGYIPNDKIVYKNNSTIEVPPHIVVAFPSEDPENLTYRTLRHLVQLHIPLRISVLVDEQYKHDIFELKRFALTRKSINIISTNEPEAFLPSSDIVISSGSYFPYLVSQFQIPCIVLCAHEEEVNYGFPVEAHGFANLGLGRKIKQSYLQNAVMEIILHENRRNAYKLRQKHFDFSGNLEEVVNSIHQAIETKKAGEEIVH